MKTWSFTDTTSDNVSATSLRDFYNGLGTVSSSSYIFFEMSGSGTAAFGAWCSERADWYVNNYKSKAGVSTGTSENSGSWNKWSRAGTGSWSAATTSAHRNYWGTTCDSNAWSWCSEWGIGGRRLAVMPGNTNSSGESYAGTWSNGAGWKATIKVGASRSATCGF